MGEDPWFGGARLWRTALARRREACHDLCLMSRASPGVRADYRRFLPITTRWMDNDVFGHVNNAAYYSFFDTVITYFLMQYGILSLQGGAHLLMVAESSCRYHSEVAFPDPLTAGLRLARLGNSSIRHEIAVFRGDADMAAAEGCFVHVCVDAATRRPAPLPGRWRQILEAELPNTEALGASARED